MWVFRWTALSPIGTLSEGLVPAVDPEDARRRLDQQRLRLVALALDPWATLREALRRRPSRAALADAVEYMADLIRLGVAPEQALAEAATTTPDRPLQRALWAAREQMRTGASLGQALEDTQACPRTLVSLIATGETTGTLDHACHEGAQKLREEQELLARFRKSWSYPLFIFGIGLGVAGFISAVVLPRLALTLEGLATLPWPTRVLLAVGAHGALGTLGLGAALILGGLGLLLWARRSPATFWPMLWRVPVFGPILHDGIVARYFANLATYLARGFSLLASIEGAATGLGHRALLGIVSELRQQILLGRGLTDALKHPDFPRLAAIVAARGEHTGLPAKYIAELARVLDRRMTARLTQVTTWVERLLLFGIAGFLLFIALAFLLPIYANLQTLTPYGR